jgi:hypothetical protein
MKNYLLEENLLDEQKEKNRQLERSYFEILEFIKRLSASFEIEELQTRIEIDHKLNPDTIATIHECITPYFIISLGADETGYYNIAYSLDYRAKDIIGECALSNLLRTIYRFTMNGYTDTGIEHRVKVHSLAMDTISIYKQLYNNGDNSFTKMEK